MPMRLGFTSHSSLIISLEKGMGEGALQVQDLEAAIHEFGGALFVAVEGAGFYAQDIQLGFRQDAGVHAGIVGKAFDEGGIFGGGVVHEFNDVDLLVES